MPVSNAITPRIESYNFHGHTVRIFRDAEGNIWFVAKDVCDILGTSTRDIRKILDDDEISTVDSIHIAQNGGKAPLCISESGFYTLVLRSRKPIAKDFRRWVTHEVLPSVREQGAYLTPAVAEQLQSAINQQSTTTESTELLLEVNRALTASNRALAASIRLLGGTASKTTPSYADAFDDAPLTAAQQWIINQILDHGYAQSSLAPKEPAQDHKNTIRKLKLYSTTRRINGIPVRVLTPLNMVEFEQTWAE